MVSLEALSLADGVQKYAANRRFLVLSLTVWQSYPSEPGKFMIPSTNLAFATFSSSNQADRGLVFTGLSTPA